jgi:thiol-disulfide isomerase/thioredoxin
MRAFVLWLTLWSTASFAQAPGGSFQQAKPWLGVAIDQGKTGVLVKDVLPGTPAQEAGLKAGDEIVAIDQTGVGSPTTLIKTIQAQGVGNAVTVHFLRAGKKEKKTVKLVARPDELELLKNRLEGKPAPAFDLAVLYGNAPGSTEKLKGKVTVVEFWATWCPACRQTHGRLGEFQKKHKNDVHVVAISDEEAPEILAYAKKVKPGFTLLQDKAKTTQEPWLVSAISGIAVLDQQGKVVFATIGAGTYLEEALAVAEKLIK